jgi:hypothetical protein
MVTHLRVSIRVKITHQNTRYASGQTLFCYVLLTKLVSNKVLLLMFSNILVNIK